ncbi:MAG TPA: undecaprenyl-diphosphate phosphatase [Cytophagales bacterium]|nr:undecaprenyl-diphosphate phosphatase [Cytophagales bacterium]
MSIIEAIILAIVEGITEFLPISSTGHMIITSAVMGINESEFVKMFTVNIQFGAILSVVVLYWKRFFKSMDFYLRLLVGVIPALFFGFLLSDKIDELLENVVVVAVMLLVGGIVLLFVDKWFNNQGEKEVSYKNAFIIGLFQCLAMVPGVSRSAASIIGGMAQKLNRKTAAEFSFFLAVPTMLAAASYKFITGFLQLDIKDDLIKFNLPKIQSSLSQISAYDLQILLIGNIVAFIVAMLAIKFFINFLSKYGFKVFGYYRIALGIIILILLALDIDLKV